MVETFVITPQKRLTAGQKEQVTQTIYTEVGQIYSHISYVDQLQRVMVDLNRKDNELCQPGSEMVLIKKLDKTIAQLRTATDQMTEEMGRYGRSIELFDSISQAATKKILWECSKHFQDKPITPSKLAAEVAKKVDMVNSTIHQAMSVRNIAKAASDREIQQLKEEMKQHDVDTITSSH